MQEKPRDLHSRFDRDIAYGASVSRAVAVGVASIIVLVANKARKKALFINDSATVIYLTKGPTATLNTGIRLNAGGGSWEEAPDQLGYMWAGIFSAITSVAAQNLIVIEDM